MHAACMSWVLVRTLTLLNSLAAIGGVSCEWPWNTYLAGDWSTYRIAGDFHHSHTLQPVPSPPTQVSLVMEGARSTCPLLMQLLRFLYIYIYTYTVQCACTCMPSCVCNIQEHVTSFLCLPWATSTCASIHYIMAMLEVSPLSAFMLATALLTL